MSYTVTVKELIAQLQAVDQNAEVVFDDGGAFYDISEIVNSGKYVELKGSVAHIALI